jgi:hypothetical protein
MPELKPDIVSILLQQELEKMIKDEIVACCKKLKLSQNIAENYDSIEAKDRAKTSLPSGK